LPAAGTSYSTPPSTNEAESNAAVAASIPIALIDGTATSALPRPLPIIKLYPLLKE
jgi:hypothetical protein